MTERAEHLRLVARYVQSTNQTVGKKRRAALASNSAKRDLPSLAVTWHPRGISFEAPYLPRAEASEWLVSLAHGAGKRPHQAGVAGMLDGAPRICVDRGCHSPPLCSAARGRLRPPLGAVKIREQAAG
ncbi:hypothetical protein NDU88_005073 [Pleurodeles waltl]|uniref:Uncharacterized protein n=1 Tax=Pleurodeles waltl TaxID=8319 RepID=A0AAV7TA80_PLEWA|nr:hypothetical protein NDU88_005073 [Pleurodeles waltl]